MTKLATDDEAMKDSPFAVKNASNNSIVVNNVGYSYDEIRQFLLASTSVTCKSILHKSNGVQPECLCFIRNLFWPVNIKYFLYGAIKNYG